MKKIVSLILAIAMLGTTACSSNPKEEETTTQESAQLETPQDAPGKIGFITGTGGLGDKNLNDLTFAGAQLAEKDGIEVDVVEPKESSDYPSLQELFSETGDYAAIICVGFDQLDSLTKIADKFPNQQFILADIVLEKPNVTSVKFRAEETGFQLGVLAGLLVKEGNLANSQGKNTIGFVGGMDIPTINEFATGYSAGAKLVNPDITILNSYVGSFSDPGKATELATGLYESGADIIFACAGGSGLGVIAAAEKSNGYALGIETNQNVLAPDNMIASGIRDWDTAIHELIGKAVDGQLSGELVSYGIKENTIRAEREGSNVEVDEAIISQMSEFDIKIANGEIVIPKQLADVDMFLQEYK